MSDIDVSDSLSNVQDGRILDAPAPPRPVPIHTVFTALAALVFTEAMLRTKGYAWLRQRLIRMRPPGDSPIANESECMDLLAAVDRAAVYYPRPSLCLLRSTVLTWLLRRRGIPAFMVIGCRHTPFYAHAWVELDGRVLNDTQTVKELYPEMERV